MSVVPSSYCAAGIDQKKLARRDAAIALAGDAVMHDGAVGARAGDGGERNVFQQPGVAAKTLQRLDRIDFAQAPGRRFAIEPGQKTRHRGAVAFLCGARARDLDRVLHRLHRRDRVAAAQNFAAVLRHQARDRFGAGSRIEPHGALLAAEDGEVAFEIGGRAHRGKLLEAMADIVAELAALDIEKRPALPAARWRKRAPPACAEYRCRGY